MKLGTGALFPATAHSTFTTLTRTRYDGMVARLEKKKIIDVGRPPFSLADFRAHVLIALNGNEDGFSQCRYCKGFFSLKDVAADHEMPLSRGGSAGLDNIGFPCQQCNQQKSSMTPDEFLKLLRFLETEIPMAWQDVLSRLAKAVQLAAGMFRNQPIIGALRESGEWQKATAARSAKKKAKIAGLKEF